MIRMISNWRSKKDNNNIFNMMNDMKLLIILKIEFLILILRCTNAIIFADFAYNHNYKTLALALLVNQESLKKWHILDIANVIKLKDLNLINVV